MRTARRWLLLSIAALAAVFGSSCIGDSRKKNGTVIIQPYDDFGAAQGKMLKAEITGVLPGAILRPPCPLPGTAFYPPRDRYRADSLIAGLARSVKGDSIIIGITTSDISTTKGDIADWGVMGLAYTPGSACVVSTFRLSRQHRRQLYKIALHELGHTQGLPHCPDKTCFMRDAEGGNPTDEETGFCPQCKAFLQGRGWRLK